MKKYIKYLAIVLFMLFPIVVKADKSPLAFDGYSLQGAVGSEIIFEIKGYSDFDGTITYNKDELTFISKDVVNSEVVEGPYGPMGDIDIVKNTPGELKFIFQNDEESNDTGLKTFRFTFKVKSVSSGNKVVITYIPDDTAVLYGSENYTREYDIIPTSSLSSESAEIKEKVNEIQGKATEIIDKSINNINRTFTIMTYIPWAISGLLFVALIIVIVKKRKTN